MNLSLSPATPGELAEALAEAVVRNRRVQIVGKASKNGMGGPIGTPNVTLSTAPLNHVLAYEPKDLTISVGAGMPWRELTALLAQNRQMIPLDPPFAETATVGGVIATNGSGPRQRLYGTARDLVIGMCFATAQGKLVRSGGMVVKNVAGLDMAKLMIGSFGTLAAIASVNFKLTPMPEVQQTFLLKFVSAEETVAARNRILKSQLQPSAMDILNPAASKPFQQRGWILAIRCGGASPAMERYAREFEPLGAETLQGDQDRDFWQIIEDVAHRFLVRHPDGAIARASCTLKGLGTTLASLEAPAIARAGTGACYGYFAQAEAAQKWAADATAQGHAAVVEFAPESLKSQLDQWPAPGAGLDTMRRIKRLFDPENLLNVGRLYGRI